MKGKESAGPWARRVLGDWFVCYPSSSFAFSLIVPTARTFDKSNFSPPPPPSPQPKGPAEQSAGVNILRVYEDLWSIAHAWLGDSKIPRNIPKETLKKEDLFTLRCSGTVTALLPRGPKDLATARLARIPRAIEGHAIGIVPALAAEAVGAGGFKAPEA